MLKLGVWLLPILTAVGIGSVVSVAFLRGTWRGDLRFFVTVQVYAGPGALGRPAAACTLHPRV